MPHTSTTTFLIYTTHQINDNDDLPDLQYSPTNYDDSSYDGDVEDMALQAMSDSDSNSKVDIDPY